MRARVARAKQPAESASTPSHHRSPLPRSGAEKRKAAPHVIPSVLKARPPDRELRCHRVCDRFMQLASEMDLRGSLASAENTGLYASLGPALSDRLLCSQVSVSLKLQVLDMSWLPLLFAIEKSLRRYLS